MSTEYGYFSGLFSSLLKEPVLQEVWSEAVHATGRGDASAVFHHAVYLASAKLEVEEGDEDFKLACRLQKAERRREAKRRNKERKKKSAPPTDSSTKRLHGANVSLLSEQDKGLYSVVCEVLGSSKLLYDESVIINAVLDCEGDANAAIGKLMFEERNIGPLDIPVDSSASYRDEESKSSPRSPTTGTPVLPTLRSPHLSAEQLSNLQPLLNHCVHHLRSRNPGIQIALDQDCLIYKGTQRPLARTGNPSELLIEIDLHGITRKPAVDILQSSLLYYHSILGTKALDTMCSREECAVVESASGSRKTGPASSLSSTVKCITVLYVVGQGIHSPGAVPILRNTCMRELDSFWSVFEHGIDAANEGQVYVKVRKLK